jgi:hypothetical protein
MPPKKSSRLGAAL